MNLRILFWIGLTISLINLNCGPNSSNNILNITNITVEECSKQLADLLKIPKKDREDIYLKTGLFKLCLDNKNDAKKAYKDFNDNYLN